jgi:hypothetical protein
MKLEDDSDNAYDLQRESITRFCRACPDCAIRPCEGCQQGGECDAACWCERGEDSR